MNVQFTTEYNDGRALLEAETPAEAYWLAGVVREISDAGYDVRTEFRERGGLVVQLPLIRREIVKEQE